VCGLIAAVLLAGCQPKAAVKGSRQSQQSRLRQADQADALLKAAANQLNDLPAAVDTVLRPPIPILDAEKHPEHADTLAVCLANPTMPGSPVNVVYVPTGSGHFKRLRVQSGDMLKYFAKMDKTVDDDAIASGLTKLQALDLRIAQVIDDNTLLLEGGLSQPIEVPLKIEIWRNVDSRQREINEKLVLYDSRRLPPLGWEPAPDEPALAQVLAWLNQWIRQTDPPTEWKRDPLIDTLPGEITNSPELKPFLSLAGLAAKSFAPHEGRLLQEAIWLRDIARWAHGHDFNDLARGGALFDWTVRNVQLVDDESTLGHRPWHTLLYGRGTAAQRAWVFARLCRAQGLTAVILGVPMDGGVNPASNSPPNLYWLVAIVAADNLYLFDPTLGLAIKGPSGQGVATLVQAQKDDSLLRALDLDGAPYPISAAQLNSAKAFIVADTFELSRRASQLESLLTGDDRVILSASASAAAAKLKSSTGIDNLALWDVPFQTLLAQLTREESHRHREALAFEPFAVRPTLWQARTRHFQGRRKPATEPGGEPLDDHQEAVRLYMSVRKADRKIADSASSDERRVESATKRNATYWLGLLRFDDEHFGVAADWFRKPEINADKSPSSAGAHYNLARSLEAQQQFQEAAEILEKSDSPQKHGDLVRARELRSQAIEKPVVETSK
jgi:hypothetical protein